MLIKPKISNPIRQLDFKDNFTNVRFSFFLNISLCGYIA